MTRSVARLGVKKEKAAIERSAPAPRRCQQLLGEAECGRVIECGKIEFAGVDGFDVYNITAPFTFDGQTLIAGRVERRETEFSSIKLFQRGRDGRWSPCPGAPVFEGLQDPCITRIDGELILGGVRFPIERADGSITYGMDFYRGRTLDDLRPLFSGPEGMKDIRLVGLADGRVGLFSRPQGKKGGRGKIGFCVVDSLEAISAELIQDAPLFPGQFVEEEWGGANEAHVLRNGRIGVLAHIARFDEREHRHYYGMVFAVDPETGSAGPMRIIAQRRQFPAGHSKRADLDDVIFSGGIVRNWDGTATLFAGLSDAEAGYLRMPDPFVELENV